MNHIAGLDSEMASTPQVETGTTGQLELAIDSEITLIGPNTIDPRAELTMSKEFAGANCEVGIEP